MNQNPLNSNTGPFQSRRIVSRHVEKIKASPSQIFPLLCPIQEYKWIDGWKCEMVYSDSGAVENNCVFKEEKTGPILFDMAIPTYWVVSLYDPERHRIQFVLLSGTISAAKLDVEINGLDEALSTGTWTFTITSLNEETNRMINATTEQKAKLILSTLGRSLKHYCETGQLLRLNRINLMRMGFSSGLVGMLKSHLSHPEPERK